MLLPDEYVKQAMRTESPRSRQVLVLSAKDAQALNAAEGLCGEAGELMELFKKHHFHGQPLDREKILKELGDIQWYVAQMCSALDASLEEDVMARNIEKLRRRYPLAFDDLRAAEGIDR